MVFKKFSLNKGKLKPLLNLPPNKKKLILTYSKPVIIGLFLLLFSISFLLFGVFSAKGATITWDGGGTTELCGAGNENDWSCAYNWSTDTIPGAADAVVFDSGTSNKNSTIDSSAPSTVYGIDWSGYTGTITQEKSISMTEYYQNDGLFTCADPDTYTFSSSNFVLGGGTFERYTLDESIRLIHDVYGLQAITQSLSSDYKIHNNINASVTSGWNENPGIPGQYFGFLPIGDFDNPFTGSLDGNNKTISNLVINGMEFVDSGLFDNIDMGVKEIKNLTISTITVTVNNTSGGGGTLAGYLTSGTVDNVDVTGTLETSNTDYLGGLVGYNQGTIENSSVDVDVTASNQYGVGGLVGYNEGTITGSISSGAIATSDATNVGGLLGWNSGGTVSNSSATGSVIDDNYGDVIGGLVGYSQSSGSIENSFATGNVSGANSIGGLVGQFSNGTITGSHATGTVTSDDSNGSNFGGLAGSCDSASSISTSYATGNLGFGDGSNPGDAKGGLVGYLDDCDVDESYSAGEVEGGYSIGGLVGIAGFGITITDSYSKGNVYAFGDFAGGLVSQTTELSTISIYRSYSSGTVNAESGYGEGGFIGGDDATLDMLDNYWLDDTVLSDTYNFDVAEITAINSTQMQTQSTYTNVPPNDVAWDFTDTWYIDDGNAYPILLWQDEAPYIWIGSGNWSTGSNWNKGVEPTIGGTVWFNGDSSNNSTIDASFGGTIASLTITNGYTSAITVSKDLIVTGALDIDGTGGINTSSSKKISVGGDYIIGENSIGGTVLIELNGSGDQSIGSDSSYSMSPNLTINKASGDVTTLNSFTVMPDGEFTSSEFTITATGAGEFVNTTDIYCGDFIMTAGTVSGGGYIYVLGDVTGDSGTISDQTVTFYGYEIEQNWTPGSTSWDNVDIIQGGTSSDSVTILGGDATVTGNFNLYTSINGSYKVKVAGDYLIGSLALGGTATIELNATGDQVIYLGAADNTSGFSPAININKSSGDVLFDTSSGDHLNIYDGSSWADLTLSQGTIDLTGTNLYLYADEFSQTGDVVTTSAGTYGITSYINTLTGVSGAWTTADSVYIEFMQNTTWRPGSVDYSALNVDLESTVTIDGGSTSINYLYLTGQLDNTLDEKLGVKANFDIETTATGGTGTILLNGTGAQEITLIAPGGYSPNLEINKSSGDVTPNTGFTISTDGGSTRGNLTITRTGTGSLTGTASINANNVTMTAGTVSGFIEIYTEGNVAGTAGSWIDSSQLSFGAASGSVTQNFTPGNVSWNNIYLNNFDGTDVVKLQPGATLTATNITVDVGNFDANTNDVAVDLSGNLTIADSASAIFNAPSTAAFNLAGNFTKGASGEFNHNSGTLTLDKVGSTVESPQNVDGSPTFNNLIMSTDDQYISFGALSTTTIAGTWTVGGSGVGNEVYLIEDGVSGGDRWTVAYTGNTSNITYVKVQDSLASPAIEVLAWDDKDNGNNSGWSLLETAGPSTELTTWVWDGGGDGSTWTDPLNWDRDSYYPSNAYDKVTIDNVQLSTPAGSALTLGELIVGNGNATTLTLANDLTVDSANGQNGNLTVVDTIDFNGQETIVVDGTIDVQYYLVLLGNESVTFGSLTGTGDIGYNGDGTYDGLAMGYDYTNLDVFFGDDTNWPGGGTYNLTDELYVNELFVYTGTVDLKSNNANISGSFTTSIGTIVTSSTGSAAISTYNTIDNAASTIGQNIDLNISSLSSDVNWYPNGNAYENVNNWQTGYTTTLHGSVEINGDLNLSGGYLASDSADLSLAGDLILGSDSTGGDVVINIDGDGDQVIYPGATDNTSGFSPAININKSSGDVLFDTSSGDHLNIYNGSDWADLTLAQGTIDLTDVNLYLYADEFSQTGNVVTTSAGTYGITSYINTLTGVSGAWTTADTIYFEFMQNTAWNGGSVDYSAVSVDLESTSAVTLQTNSPSISYLWFDGTLDRAGTETLTVSTLDIGSNAAGGSGYIKFTGSGNISSSGGTGPNVEIDIDSGTVSVDGDTTIGDLVITDTGSGSLALNAPLRPTSFTQMAGTVSGDYSIVVDDSGSVVGVNGSWTGDSTLVFGGGTQDWSTGDVEWNNVHLDGGTTVTISSVLVDINGILIIYDDGVNLLNAGSNTINISGHWYNGGGASNFDAGTGEVVFDGTDQEIAGSTTFNDLTITGGDRTITFEEGSTQIVGGVLTMTGTEGHNLILTDETDNTTTWKINPTSDPSNWFVDYVTVNDSENLNDTDITPTVWTNNGDNSGWSTLVSTPTAASDVAIGNLSIPEPYTTASFDVTWTDNSDNETGFKVFVSTTPNADCSAATYPGSPDYTAAADDTSQPVSGKTINTQYCAKVIATNASIDSDPAYSSPVFTLANTPGVHTISVVSATSLNIVIDANNNPASTEFYIRNSTTGYYLGADGVADESSPLWQTRAAWGGDSGIANTGLAANTSYTYVIGARNGDSTTTDTASSAATYTGAYTPTVGSTTVLSSTVIHVVIGTNSNPANVEYAIACDATGTTWLAANGLSCGASKVWQTISGWTVGGIMHQNLSVNTEYSHAVLARNADQVETDLSAAVADYTQSNDPGAPIVDTPTTTSLKITIDQNGNPANTRYAIYNQTLNKYVDSNDGSLRDTEDWQTYATFGGASGIVNIGLSANTSYTYKVKADNGDGVETGLSDPTSATTSAIVITAPSNVTIGNLATTTFDVTWDDNSDNETGFEIYISTQASDNCSAATYPAEADYTTAADAESQSVEEASINTQYCAKIIATDGTNNSSAAYSDDIYTLVDSPDAPIVNTPAYNSLKITLDLGDNPETTEHAIYNNTLSKYLGADGVADEAAAVWQTYEEWGGVNGTTNTGLSASTEYSYKVMARNGGLVETDWSGNATASTVASRTITASAGANGSITPSGTVTVSHGANQNFVFTPDSGYTIADVLVDSVSVGAVSSYNLENITADRTISVSFILSSITAPSNVTIDSVTTTGFTVNWQDNSSNETGFKLYISTSVLNSDCDDTGTVYPSTPDYSIALNIKTKAVTNKTPGAEYCVKIAATNGGIDSAVSYSTNNFTLALAPGIPTVSDVSYNKVKITLNSSGNGVSTSYLLRLCKDGDCTYVSSVLHRSISEVWRSYSYWGGAEGTYIYMLDPNANYSIAFTAKNGLGVTTSSSDITFTTTPVFTGLNLSYRLVVNHGYTLFADWVSNGASNVIIQRSKIDSPFVGNIECSAQSIWATHYVNPSEDVVASALLNTYNLLPNTAYCFRIGTYSRSGNQYSIIDDGSIVYSSPFVINMRQSFIRYSDISSRSVKMKVDLNGNPEWTQFSIYNANSGTFLQENGRFGSSEVVYERDDWNGPQWNTGLVFGSDKKWLTYDQIGGDGGLVIDQLTPSTPYFNILFARNLNGEEMSRLYPVGGVEFTTLDEYRIRIIGSENATINPIGENIYQIGSSQTFTFEAKEGHEIEDVIIDGASIGKVNKYTFKNITSDHTIEVRTKAITIAAVISETIDQVVEAVQDVVNSVTEAIENVIGDNSAVVASAVAVGTSIAAIATAAASNVASFLTAGEAISFVAQTARAVISQAASILTGQGIIQTVTGAGQAAGAAAGQAAGTSAGGAWGAIWNFFASALGIRTVVIRKKSGRIVESGTNVPVPQVKVELYKVEDVAGQSAPVSRLVDKTFSDAKGYYGFVAEPGKYIVRVYKDKYQIDDKSALVVGTMFEIKNDRDSLVMPNIGMSMTSQAIEKNIKVLSWYKYFEIGLSIFSFVALIVGTVVVTNDWIKGPGIFTYILSGVYLLLWIFNVTKLIKKSPWGMTIDKSGNSSIPLTLVRILDKTGSKLIRTVVSNQKGKYSALVPKGEYMVLASKPGYKQAMLDNISTSDMNRVVNNKIRMERG